LFKFLTSSFQLSYSLNSGLPTKPFQLYHSRLNIQSWLKIIFHFTLIRLEGKIRVMGESSSDNSPKRKFANSGNRYEDNAVGLQRVKAPDRKSIAKKSKSSVGAKPVPPQLRDVNKKPAVQRINQQQRKFIDLYVMTGLVGDSALRAGYKTVVSGTELLRRPIIRREIARKRAKIQAITDEMFSVDAKAVLRELGAIAFANMGDYFADWGYKEQVVQLGKNKKTGEPVTATIARNFAQLRSKDELTEQQQRAIAQIKEDVRGNVRSFTFKNHDKVKALGLLGQYFGLFDGGGKGIDPSAVVRDLRTAASVADRMMPAEEDSSPEQELEDDADAASSSQQQQP